MFLSNGFFFFENIFEITFFYWFRIFVSTFCFIPALLLSKLCLHFFASNETINELCVCVQKELLNDEASHRRWNKMKMNREQKVQRSRSGILFDEHINWQKEKPKMWNETCTLSEQANLVDVCILYGICNHCARSTSINRAPQNRLIELWNLKLRKVIL